MAVSVKICGFKEEGVKKKRKKKRDTLTATD